MRSILHADDALGDALAAAVGARAAPPAVPTSEAGPLLQRMNLAQTGWLEGTNITALTTKVDVPLDPWQPPVSVEAPVTRQLVTDGRMVNVYVETLPAASNRITAHQAAAEANANLGKLIDEKVLNEWRLSRGKWWNEKWTLRHQPHNDGQLKRLDPFYYGVRVPFMDVMGAQFLELLFQHAVDWTAYVQGISDTSNVSTRPFPTMYDSGTQHPNTPSTDVIPQYEWLAYSNKHYTQAPRTNLFGETTGGEHHHFDAYTKLVGEGARWKCVRAHIEHLTDDSLFFTRSKSRPENVYGVTFRTLWASWASVFDKAFDIDDDLVAKRIRDESFDRARLTVLTVRLNSRTNADYDLDRHRSHR